MNDPKALDELLRECERNNPTVQAYLAHVLPNYQDGRVVPALIKLVNHTNRDIAFQATWALGETGNAAAIYSLRRLLSRKDPILKMAAENALRRLGGPVRRVMPAWAYAVGVGVVLFAVGFGWFVIYK